MERVMEKSYSLILKRDGGIKHLTQSFTLKHLIDAIPPQLRRGGEFLPKAPWCHNLRPTVTRSNFLSLGFPDSTSLEMVLSQG